MIATIPIRSSDVAAFHRARGVMSSQQFVGAMLSLWLASSAAQRLVAIRGSVPRIVVDAEISSIYQGASRAAERGVA